MGKAYIAVFNRNQGNSLNYLNPRLKDLKEGTVPGILNYRCLGIGGFSFTCLPHIPGYLPVGSPKPGRWPPMC